MTTASPALLTPSADHSIKQYTKILDYAIRHGLMRGGSNDHSAADRVLQRIAALEQRVADLRNRLNLSEKLQGRLAVDAVQPDPKEPR